MNNILKNFLSILTGNFLGKILAFIFSLYIARELGAEVFGVVNFANSIITYFFMISSMGLQTYGILQISKINNEKYSNEEVSNIFSEIMSSRIILTIISIFCLIIYLILSKNFNISIKIMILLYGLTIISNCLNIDWYFTAIKNMKLNSIWIIIQNSTSLIALILLNILDIKNMYIIPITIFIGEMIANIILMIKASKRIKFKFSIDITRILTLVKLSFPFFFSGIFATINCNIDTIFLGYMTNPVEVGLYNSAYKIINMLIVIATIIFTPIYPILIELYNNENSMNFDKLTNLINIVRKIIMIISIPILFISFILGKNIISTFYGKTYIEASNVLSILLIYVALLYIRELYGYRLNACGLQNKYMKIVCFSAFINIVLNIILIPIWGMIGSAITTLFSEIINLIFMYYISQKYKYIKNVNNYLIKIIVSSLIISIICVFIKMYFSNAILISTIGLSIYIILIIIIGVIKKSDLVFLREN